MYDLREMILPKLVTYKEGRVGLEGLVLKACESCDLSSYSIILKGLRLRFVIKHLVLSFVLVLSFDISHIGCEQSEMV